MGLAPVEFEHEDVLQNIESAVVGCFRADPGLVDWDVEAAYEAMIRTVRAQAEDREPPDPQLSERALVVYSAVAGMVAWRLGVAQQTDERDRSVPRPEPITTTEMMRCLKRLQRSLRTWNKQGGRQGYLRYIDQFLA